MTIHIEAILHEIYSMAIENGQQLSESIFENLQKLFKNIKK